MTAPVSTWNVPGAPGRVSDGATAAISTGEAAAATVAVVAAAAAEVHVTMAANRLMKLFYKNSTDMWLCFLIFDF